MCRRNLVLWNYEDITAKVWSCRSVEQLDVFLQHVLKIFRDSMPHALISERWAQTALQLGLSCSSRHYAGRSLQVTIYYSNNFLTYLYWEKLIYIMVTSLLFCS